MGHPAELRICIVGSDKESALKKGLKEINEALQGGFEIYGQPALLSGNRVLYSLLKPEVKDKVYGETAYPSDKQLGYIRWAFNVPEFDVQTRNLTRRECSDLISWHKDNHDRKQLNEKYLVEQLKTLRPDGEPEPEKDKDEYNDDLPF